MDEWRDIKPKIIALKYPRDSLQGLWFLINKYSKEDYLNLIKLAHLALTCPVHTSGCERGFSVQNSILTPVQNQHTRCRTCSSELKHLDQKFDFGAAIHKWWSQRSRKICKKYRQSVVSFKKTLSSSIFGLIFIIIQSVVILLPRREWVLVFIHSMFLVFSCLWKQIMIYLQNSWIILRRILIFIVTIHEMQSCCIYLP